MEEIQPDYCVFGHIHESYGERNVEGMKTKFINAAIVGLDYKPKNNPKTFYLKRKIW